jgi:hypothetical protein
MAYYTIQNNGILTAETEYALSRFYDNVQPLPEDYEIGKYIVENGELVRNPNYEAEQELKEKERVARLSCTKRDFALMLQELGITYSQLKELIATNEQAQLEWELCERLYRFNPMLDVMAGQLGITPEQLDGLFKYANGEITLEEFKGLTADDETSSGNEAGEGVILEEVVVDESTN